MDEPLSEHVLLEKGRPRGNFILAMICGLIAAIVGAAVWMGLTLATGLHVGIVAIGVGALVGSAIRFGGKGVHMIYGLMGVIFTMLSCVTGEAAAIMQSATTPEMDFYAALTHTDLIALVWNIVVNTSPMMALIYAVGLFEAYKISIRR